MWPDLQNWSSRHIHFYDFKNHILVLQWDIVYNVHRALHVSTFYSQNLKPIVFIWLLLLSSWIWYCGCLWKTSYHKFVKIFTLPHISLERLCKSVNYKCGSVFKSNLQNTNASKAVQPNDHIFFFKTMQLISLVVLLVT